MYLFIFTKKQNKNPKKPTQEQTKKQGMGWGMV